MAKEEEEDCISELPDEVIFHILCFLPVADAFSFKLLSRRWSRLQVPVSNLYFNQDTIFGRQFFLENCDVEKAEKLKSEFVEKVDWFLNLFRGPFLNAFMVNFWLDNESASVIDNWVSFAVSKQAESIELDFYKARSILLDDTRTHQILYKFPFHLLPAPKTLARLKHLRLSACLVLLTPHSPFNCLKTLELNDLPLDQTSLDGVLSSSLDLEWLTLDQCELPWTLRVSSARLRGIRFYHCLNSHTIELNASQLQAFEYSGRFLKLFFLLLPPLERVHFGLASPYMALAFFDLLTEVRPKLQILSLDWCNFKASNVPTRIPEFGCLKQLDFFSSPYRQFDLISIINVLNACPMLQKFNLHINFTNVCSESGQIEKVVYAKNVKYLHLEEIEISGFWGTPNQMKLLRYLLNNAVALKHMTLIYSQWKSHNYKGIYVEHHDPSWSKRLSKKKFHDSLRKEMISHGAELIIC